MNETTMDFATKTEFVDALLACPAMQSRQIRDAMVNALEDVQGISRSDVDRADVANIVDRVLDFQGGMAQLLERLRFYEGNSVHMQRVDAFYAQHDESDEVASLSDKSKLVGTDVNRFNYQLLWALICLILLLGIFGIGWLVRERFNISTQPEPMATPQPTVTPLSTTISSPAATPLSFTPATEDETLILITNFYLADEIDDAEPHRKIAKAIQQEIKKHKLTDVRVEIEEAVRLREDEREDAHELAARYNASIIIWGDETSTDITVNFLNLRQPDYAIGYVTIEADDKSVHKAALSNPAPYIQFMTHDLPSQLTFLALFALAQSEYDQEEYINAISFCERAIEYGKESRIQGLADVYEYLGRLYQTALENTEMSIYYYDRAIELVPTLAAAYHNRGLAYGQQGQYEQALVELDQATALEPNNVAFNNNRRIIRSFVKDITTSTPRPTLTTYPTLETETSYINSIDGANYIYVPANEFIMGSEGGLGDEQPQHIIHLDSYWIMQTEVTNAQYRKFMNANGYTTEAYWSLEGWEWRTKNDTVEPQCWTDSDFNGAQQPVVCVSWYEAEAYANWLSVKSGLDFGIPTEAQWEKAARGTDARIYPWGNQWDENKTNSWSSDDGYQDMTAPVGSYLAGMSPYGALDMAGNVWEWTADWYAADYFQSSPIKNPQGPDSGSHRVLRGGSWVNVSNYLRTANREWSKSDVRNSSVGFRLVLHETAREN